jgi:hypothetical protein
MPKIVNPAAETRDNGRMKNLTPNTRLPPSPALLPILLRHVINRLLLLGLHQSVDHVLRQAGAGVGQVRAGMMVSP